MTTLERLQRIRSELSQCFVERDQVIEGALVCLLAQQHLLLIGPPGTAKSMLADELCSRLEGAQYFQWLLTRFSTPEELFGAVSLAGLEHDEYRRVTTGKLPEAHIAFLDEVFKANSSILNALLAIMNERRFHNGREVAHVPLLTLFGATNELPDDDELQALYDRFLVRFVVDYIAEDHHFLRMLEGRAAPERTSLSLEDLRILQALVCDVRVPQTIYRTLADLRKELARKGIVASDRRYRQAVSLLQARALLRGDHAVAEDDVFFLEHVLWRAPTEQKEVRATIRELLRGYEDEARALLFQGKELEEYANRSWDNVEMRSRAVVEAHTKLRHLLHKVSALVEAARTAGRPTDRVEAVRQEIEEIQKRMLETL
jgi:MoxR-like ATPase